MIIVIYFLYITPIIYNVNIKRIHGVTEMKVSKAEAAQTKERITEVASRLFREFGLEGIGVAELMKAAGLTHGGFYRHFASKEELMASACARGLEGSLNAAHRVVEHHPKQALSAMASAYLSAAHRDAPGEGCVLAALGAEAAHHGALVRAAITEGVRPMITLLMQLLPSDMSEDTRCQRAITIYSSMIGALVLARAVDDVALSDMVLTSVLASISHADLYS
jgi:TetR/AcrR family transcriptional repressor of nem operon